MHRSGFLAFAMTIAGSLACAHLLAAAILPPPPRTISLELIAPVKMNPPQETGSGPQRAT